METTFAQLPLASCRVPGLQSPGYTFARGASTESWLVLQTPVGPGMTWSRYLGSDHIHIPLHRSLVAPAPAAALAFTWDAGVRAGLALAAADARPLRLSVVFADTIEDTTDRAGNRVFALYLGIGAQLTS